MDISQRDVEKSKNSRSLETNPYFRFNSGSKHIEDQVFKCRGIIINERFWNKIRDELTELLKDQGPLVLYQLGLSYGVDVGFQGRSLTNDSANTIKFLEYYGLLAGWGCFETSDFQLKDGRIGESVTVKIRDSFFAQTTKNHTGIPSCYFVSGMLAGIAEGLFEEGHHCLEKRCLSTGSEFCEFIIRRNFGDSTSTF